MSILQRLGLVPATVPPRDRGLVEDIERLLAHLEPGRAEFVAVFAGLLARVAFADQEISEAEVSRIETLILGHGGLSLAEAQAVAAIARHKTLRSAEPHLLTRRFGAIASGEQRLALIDCLYAVASADDLVAFVEDVEVRRIADALLVPWSEVLKIRSRYREKLEELQQLRALRERGS
ncbi:MAG: TerB family tellurite resistance protein [Candidatus Binatia bacterium]